MNSRLAIAWGLVAASALALVAPAVLRYRHAVAQASATLDATQAGGRLRREADDIVRSLPAWARTQPRPGGEPALAQMFAAAVTSAGLAPAAVEAFTPSSATVIEAVPGTKDGPAIVRARASAALSGVTLPQLGRLLDGWRTSAPGWAVTQIDLSPLRLSTAEAATYAGSDLPLRVGLTVERLSVTRLDPFLTSTTTAAEPPKDHPR